MASFLSRRYTVVFIDRTSGVGRRLTVRLDWSLATVAFMFALPVLVGLGIRWSTVAELSSLRSDTASLEMENTSYKAATGELATQIVSLQGVIDELASRANLDPATAKAMQKLPAVVKARAMGGGTTAQPTEYMATALASPEDTFGLLRDVLGRLESRLRIVRTDVERREALAAATPSIWPTIGWLSAGFGERADPFTGDPGYHQGLDISADRGRPVVAPAAGVVESASWSGNYGNLLVIDHGFGLKTRYGHLSQFAVKAGDSVARGALIGYVGATGRATGPHLHYEVLANGQLINPLQLMLTTR
ncbi:MAG: M23 family metallopeptidase [Acidobacteria bacterium]|nr:M23 family metallopeptidase [Acidobacteriota bacterium]